MSLLKSHVIIKTTISIKMCVCVLRHFSEKKHEQINSNCLNPLSSGKVCYIAVGRWYNPTPVPTADS